MGSFPFKRSLITKGSKHVSSIEKETAPALIDGSTVDNCGLD